MIRPKRSLGQNFLIDPNYQKKIVAALGLSKEDFVLEIGPGRGALTLALIEQAFHVLAVEKDRELYENLKSLNLTLYHDDILQFDFEKLPPRKIKVVGNLPYNISSQILIRLFRNHHRFSALYLMFQKELALRIVAPPNTKAYGMLGLWAQVYSEPKILFHLPASVFRPRPKVQSSMIEFRLRSEPLMEDQEATSFFFFLQKLFQSRRKTLTGTLKRLGYPSDSIHKNTRAEQLPILDLIALYKLVFM